MEREKGLDAVDFISQGVFMGTLVDLTGQKFGRLTVLSYAGKRGKHALWHCKCDCGEVRIVQGRNLKTGNTVSCGCYIREVTAKRNTTHGMSKTGRQENTQGFISAGLT